jgi:hypothetical protein
MGYTGEKHGGSEEDPNNKSMQKKRMPISTYRKEMFKGLHV